MNDIDKSISRGKSFDMSPLAMQQRLDLWSELTAMCRELSQARPAQSWCLS